MSHLDASLLTIIVSLTTPNKFRRVFGYLQHRSPSPVTGWQNPGQIRGTGGRAYAHTHIHRPGSQAGYRNRTIRCWCEAVSIHDWLLWKIDSSTWLSMIPTSQNIKNYFDLLSFRQVLVKIVMVFRLIKASDLNCLGHSVCSMNLLATGRRKEETTKPDQSVILMLRNLWKIRSIRAG